MDRLTVVAAAGERPSISASATFAVVDIITFLSLAHRVVFAI